MEINLEKFLIELANSCMTANELSIRSGVSKSAIYKLKNGNTKIQPYTLGKIAKALGVRVEKIIQQKQ